MTIPRMNDSGPDGPDDAEARAALRRLAGHAATEPTRDLGTQAVMSRRVDAAGRDDRFDWRRLAVAAATVALVAGGATAIRQRAASSDAASSPATAQAPEVDGDVVALGAGFFEIPVWPQGRPTSAPPTARQYAADAKRPESGPYLLVNPGLYDGDASFHLTLSPPDEGESDRDGSSMEMMVTKDVSSPDASVPDGAGELFGSVFVWLDSGARCAAEVTAEGDLRPAAVGSADLDVDAGESAHSSSAVAEPAAAQSTDAGGCVLGGRMVGEVPVTIVAVGLSVDAVSQAAEHLVADPNGFGYLIEPAGLPEGFSEVAVGLVGDSFVPASAWSTDDWAAYGWRPAQSGDTKVNPVLDATGVEAASFGVVADQGEGLDGQRLGFADVRDASVGGQPAVVQVSSTGAVSVVWRQDGALYHYQERGAGLDPDATVVRANRLLPFILDPEVPDVATPTTVAPTEPTVDLDGCFDTVPPTFAEAVATIPPGSVSVAEPGDIPMTVPPCDWPTDTYPDDSIPDTTFPDGWPTTTETTTTYPGPTDTWPETTTTYPGPTDTWPETTTTYPGPDDTWPTTTTTTYPGPTDTWPTTTTYPGPDDTWVPATQPPPPAPRRAQ